MKIFCLIILQISTYSSRLNAIISQYFENPVTENVNISMSVRNIKTGDEVYSYRSKMSLPPASTLKLLTTGTALELLGAQYKFKNYVKTNGPIQNGMLNGDLIISSEGDFSFGSKRLGLNSLKDIVDVLKQNGINTVNGSIKIEENRSFDIPNDWLVGDIGNYFGAYPRQFNFNENQYSVYFNGGNEIGDSATISKILPYSADWKIQNLVKTAGGATGDQVNIVNLAPSNVIKMIGTVPLKSANFEIKGSIPDISPVFVSLLKSEMLKNGINHRTDAISSNSVISDTLAIIESPNLATIAEHCNFRSINFFADGLSNYLVQNAPDSVKLFDVFLKNYWQKKGLKLSNFSFKDGSGLSPMNTLSTNTMTSFLYLMSSSTQFNSFLASIPKVGKSGTVASMDPTGITKGKIYAKSGSLTRTRNYAGYFLNENNELFSFCIFANGINDTAQLFSRQLLQNLMFKMIDLSQE